MSREKIYINRYKCSICGNTEDEPKHWSKLIWLEEAVSGDIEEIKDICFECAPICWKLIKKNRKEILK